MGLGSFIKKAVGKTIGKTLKLTGVGKLLGAGMGKSGGGKGESTPAKPRYKRRKRNRYIAGSGYVPAAERYKRNQAALKKSKPKEEKQRTGGFKPVRKGMLGAGLRLAGRMR